MFNKKELSIIYSSLIPELEKKKQQWEMKRDLETNEEINGIKNLIDKILNLLERDK